MGIDVGITIIFFDANKSEIKRKYIECDDFESNGDCFKIPPGAYSVKIYLSSWEYPYSNEEKE